MATESPIRMVESSQASKWISSKDAAAFGSSFKSKATEDLGFFFNGQKFDLDQADLIPSRSGSAPPSMEGPVGNIIATKEYSLNSTRTGLGNFKYEGKWLTDPSYDVNLNPRLLLQSHVDLSTTSCKENQSLSTHEEKMASAEQASENLVQATSMHKPGWNSGLLASRHKSLVDLIQEDFPRTPSPVYNQSHLSSHPTVGDSVDLDVQAMSLVVSSVNISNLSDSTSSPSGVVETDLCSSSNLILNEVSPDTYPSLQHADGNRSLPEHQTCNKGAGMKEAVLTNEVVRTEEHKRTFHAEVRRHKQEVQQYNIRYKSNQTHGLPFQVPAADKQAISQGINNSQNYLGKVSHSHGHAHFSSIGLQTSLPSPGFGGPLYATPAPFMTVGNPCYPNLQSSGLFTPQYNLGGYAMNSTLFPLYMAGYSSQGALALPFGATCGPNLNGQATSLPSGDGISGTTDFQNRNKFYGQHGLALQRCYIDPFHMHYCPQPFENSYPTALQLNQSSLGAHTREHQGLDLDGQKSQPPVNGGLTLQSLRSMGITHSSYFGNSSGMGVMMQLPAPSPGSPVLPSSPIGGTHFQGVHNEMKMPQVSGRNTDFCSGHRGIGNFDGPRKRSVIEELKSINSGKFELADIVGRILEFSIDQHGSRFIQQKLESCSSEEKVSVFEEVLPHASKLMTDVFGNYVIQKFFEHGSPDQQNKLADQLSGQILPLSLQMYGCRVIQKALEVIELDQKIQLVQELDGHVMKCVRDQNGNHVIQKCIECIPMDKIHFIISSFQGQVPTLSTHPYGCRVIQRVLEHYSDEQQIQCIVDEILESAFILAQDQYGNYVTQHVLERGKPHERSQIISKLTGKIVQMSQHKYASNVIEKCLAHGSASERELLIEEIMGHPAHGDKLLAMMKDQFANYVVQKILEISNDRHREMLLNHIRVHLHALKKYTYGKHIVARFEQLAGPESEAEVH